MSQSSRHAFLIMAHHAPELLELLLRSLDHERVDIVLHIDVASSDLRSRFSDFGLRKARFHLVESGERVYWGDVSQVRAELRCFAQAAALGEHRHYHLLSGEDQLLQPIADVLRFFDKHPHHEFIGLWESAAHRRDVARKVQHHHPFTKFQSKRTRILLHKLTNLPRKLVPALEKCLGYERYPQVSFRKSYNWCSLTQNAVEQLLRERESLLRRYRQTLCPDEIYKASLLLGSPSDVRLYDCHCPNRGSQRLIDWERGAPYVFQAADLPELLASPYLFVRKCSLPLAEQLFAARHAATLDL